MISKVNKNIFIWVFLLAILAVNSFAVSVWNNSMSTSTGWTTTTGSPSFTTFDGRDVLRMGVGDEGYFLTTSNFTSGENFSITTVNYLTGTDMEQSALAMLDASRIDSSSENGYICDVYEDSGTRYARLTRCASGTCSWGGMDNTNTANFPEGTWFKLILKKRGGQLNCLATSNDGSTVYFNLSGVDGSPLTGMDYLNILNGDTGNDYVYDHEIDIDDLTVPPPANVTNFTITTTSAWDAGAVNDITANITLSNGTNYYLTNSTGNIITTPLNSSQIVNMTITGVNYLDAEYVGFNFSESLSVALNNTFINITPYEFITENQITNCNWTISGNVFDCNETFNIDPDTYNITFQSANYFTKTLEVFTDRANNQLYANSSEELGTFGAVIRDSSKQTFNSTTTYIDDVTLSLKTNTALTGNIPINILDYNNNTLATTNLDATTLTTSFQNFTIDFDLNVDTGTLYYIEVDGSVTDATNHLFIETAAGSFDYVMYLNSDVPTTSESFFYYINGFNYLNNNSLRLYNYTNALINVTVYNISGASTASDFTMRIDGLNETYTFQDSTTNGYIEFEAITGWYNLTLNDSNFALTTQTVNVTELQTLAYQFNAYTTNSINFSFYDTHTLTQLIGTNVTFEIIGDEFANNYTTDDGYLYLDLIVPFNYTLRYSAPNYYESTSAFNLVNRTTNNKTLYLINSSNYANITVTVIDEIGSKLESARVTSQRYDITTNTYRSEEVISTNFEGIGVIHAELNGELYKFLIEYPAGTLRDTTSPSIIFSDTLTLQIRISEEVLSEFDDYQGVDHNLTFNNVTNNFKFVYSDPNGVLNQACLELYTINQFSNTLLNTSCLNTVSGTILLNVTPTNGTTYQAKAYINVDSDLNLVASKIVSFGKSVLETPNWMFWNALVTGVFALLLFVVPEIGLCVIMFPTIGFSFVGLIPVHVSIPISVQLVFIVLAFAIAKKRGTL